MDLSCGFKNAMEQSGLMLGQILSKISYKNGEPCINCLNFGFTSYKSNGKCEDHLSDGSWSPLNLPD